MMPRLAALTLALAGVALLSLPTGWTIGWTTVEAMTAVPLVGQDQIYEIRIAGTAGARRRLAVPAFAVAPGASAEIQQAARTIAEVLWDDLDFEGEFYMVPHEEAARIPAANTAESLPYERWSELGVDAVVVGTVTPAQDGLSVRVQVMGVRDELARRQIFGKAYGGGGCNVRNPRYCAHYISDDFHQSQGIQGVARTRLAFASDRSSEVVSGRPNSSNVREIYIADYDGFNPRRVTVNRALNLSPSWSPDGRSLAYASTATGFWDVYVQNIYEVGRLSRPAAGTEVVQNMMPAWSPDGSRMAFASTRDGRMEIYVANRDGSSLRRLTNRAGDNLAPTWSPSGGQIAFVSGRSGVQQIYVMEADGTQVEYLNCGAPKCDRPSWSEAVNKIAYTCGSDAAGYNICVIDMASRQIVNLTEGQPGSSEQPMFAPNGRHIVFTTTRWGHRQLATIDLTGRVSPRRLTNTGNNNYPAWSPAPQ